MVADDVRLADMGLQSAMRAQRREAWFGTVLLFLFGCSVLGFLVAKDRVPWLTAAHARAELTEVASKVDNKLGRKLQERSAR
ncbi:hypothetical protein V5740_09725 [Croceibacterium sp. TMG7-5b_MA50]|uniref:hypothetical protein n=1 Tax=Croceibacterium sp. TMG7-5b_MA50 TaxID=3121290 RepID=UPI003221CE64